MESMDCTQNSFNAVVNAKNQDGDTLLHSAIVKEDENAVRFLIASGADVNLANGKNQTPLRLAFEIGNINPKSAIMKMLIEAGADVNTASEDGRTALHVAAAYFDVQLVKLLISHGADVNAKDNQNWTALHHAANSAATEAEAPAVVEILLLSNANVNAKNTKNETPLHVLLDCESEVLHQSSMFKAVQAFARHGADFQVTDRYGCTLMDTAIQNQNAEAVKALILCGGMDPNGRYSPSSSEGTTILHRACSKLDLPIVKVLLSNGANVNVLDNNFMSPLRETIESLCLKDDEDAKEGFKLVNYLLKFNPDVNTITTGGRNILTPCEDDNFIHELPDYLWKIIIQHIAKLRAMDVKIHPSLYETIAEKPEYNRYLEKCDQELEVAKNTEFDFDSSITFFNLVVDVEKQLIQYTRNLDLPKDLTEVMVVVRFPIYGSTIFKRLAKAAVYS